MWGMSIIIIRRLVVLIGGGIFWLVLGMRKFRGGE